MQDEKNEISDHKMRHILSVARLMYQLALDDGKAEDYARQMFLLGYLHDIGYEFSEKPVNHPEEAYKMLSGFYPYAEEILCHGKPIKKGEVDSYAMDLLDKADLMIDSRGNYIGARKRLEDIKFRYGETSHQYKNALVLAKRLGLLV